MKARKLKKILNNTNYTISNNRDYIAVGSPLCHDLISVDKNNLKVKYALDFDRQGRKALENDSNSKGKNELLFIWDKLHHLIESGEIHDIINGKDIIENPLPVFTVDEGVLIESVTDKYGYPNTDDNGMCMYNNTHFPTKEEAIKEGIQEEEASVRLVTRHIKELEEKLINAKNDLAEYQRRIEYLKTL